jgi:hypothetical protein
LRFRIERRRERDQRLNAQVGDTALDLLKEAGGKLGFLGERLLRLPALSAEAAHVGRDAPQDGCRLSPLHPTEVPRASTLETLPKECLSALDGSSVPAMINHVAKFVWFLIFAGLGGCCCDPSNSGSASNGSSTAYRLAHAGEESASPAATPNGSVDPNHPNANLLSESEKKYFGAAGGYLGSVNKYDTVLAKAMAGASTGESTLGDIKEAIESTRDLLNAAYYGDYQSAPPPPAFAALNKKIEKCKALHDSAFKELLAYWDDSNTAHIVSGSATLKRAALVTNECIAEVTKAMKRLSEERKKAAKSK